MAVRKFKKKFWVVLILAGLVVLVGAGALAAYLVRYSGTSGRVCEACHAELVPLWKESRGHPADKASCCDCHAPGTKLIPGHWNLARHARDQLVPPEYLADDFLTTQRCLDCHEAVLEPGYRVKKKVITFNHRVHAGEGLECVDCHRTAGHDYLAGSTNRPSVSECLNCHLKEFQGPPKNLKCLNCHEVMLVPGKEWQE